MPELDTTVYIQNATSTNTVFESTGEWFNVRNVLQEVRAHAKTGIAPQLYFRYIKSKFGVLERMKIDARIKKLEKAFYAAVDNGQVSLSEKMFKEIVREGRESMMYAKGVKHFIDHDVLHKNKNRIRDGHISDTTLDKFTRVIPPEVLKRKKEVEGLFDGFVIYHYWNENAEKVRAGKQKMTPEEKSAMRDPVLFGVIKESNRLYFIAEWEDEHCDLTFEEMIDVIGGKDEDHTISRTPKLTPNG